MRQLDEQSLGKRELVVLELPGAHFWSPLVASFSPKQEDVSDTGAHSAAQTTPGTAVTPGTPEQWSWVNL